MPAIVAAPDLGLWPEPTESFWTSLRFLAISRLVLVLLLLTVVVLNDNGQAAGEGFARRDFIGIGSAYLAAALAFLTTVNRLRPWFHVQLVVHVLTDLLALVALMHAAGGGRSGVGVLMIGAVAGAAVLCVPRMAAFFAALATLLLLGESSLRALQPDGFDPAVLVQAGLTGLACFVVAIVVSWLATRLAAQEALAQRRGDDLRSQLAITRLVIAESPQGVVLLDERGGVRTMNRSAQQLLGGTGQSESLQRLARARLAPDRELEVDLGTGKMSHRVRVRHLEPDPGKQAGDSVLVIEDLRQVEERAQQLKLASMGRLSASIAHEIRNPLAAIRHANGLLAEQLESPLASRLGRIIEDNSVRIDRIVEDVLSIARRDRPTPEPLAVRDFLHGVLAELMASGQVDASRIVLSIEASEPILFDSHQLRLVLVNLLTNALRYASPGAGAVRIAWRRAADDRLEFIVADDGPGLSPDMLKHAFEPFFTSEARGTGLGLYLAREFCDANGASIRYESRDHELPYRSAFVIRPRQ
ncbi:MAG TPA: ATP-binding protein [Burkholderiaceae bacterium]|nr:ATP-binding protein [Burkholderiaceae bacterium]